MNTNEQSQDPDMGDEYDATPRVEDVEEIEDPDDEVWSLGPQLAQLLASSDDLDREISDQIDRRLRGRSAMSDVLDLIGLGWSTMKVLLITDTSPADSEEEGL